ncbi:hypothetical protein FISHEDRAFT_61894 [Fistulina hepatica ATCC 64428]|uniref:Uncharacterized protein n=1 Tax=Fistulina hepatica ATCC 64428 TaxID=1128425 RepID=A0A0D7A0N9_9AGAR|nr:hypothetical protein FISHEDRAFT_61894 [Fistulina hepatica ATCC 64428]
MSCPLFRRRIIGGKLNQIACGALLHLSTRTSIMAPILLLPHDSTHAPTINTLSNTHQARFAAPAGRATAGSLDVVSLILVSATLSGTALFILCITGVLPNACIRLWSSIRCLASARSRFRSSRSEAQRNPPLRCTTGRCPSTSESFCCSGPRKILELATIPTENRHIVQELTCTDAHTPLRKALIDRSESALFRLLSRTALESMKRRTLNRVPPLPPASQPQIDADLSVSTTSSSRDSILRDDVAFSTATVSTRSSVTSIDSLASSDSNMESDNDPDIEVYELRRAQAQSMEVKKGVLLDWRLSGKSDIFSLPVSSSKEAVLGLSVCPSIPSLMVTSPSNDILPPSASSVSVDLSDFPLPPSLLGCTMDSSFTFPNITPIPASPSTLSVPKPPYHPAKNIVPLKASCLSEGTKDRTMATKIQLLEAKLQRLEARLEQSSASDLSYVGLPSIETLLHPTDAKRSTVDQFIMLYGN